MRALYFDCFSGVSGDMLLGALLDLGIDKEIFLNELKKLNLDEYEVEIHEKDLNSIRVMDVNVIKKHLRGCSYHDNHILSHKGDCHCESIRNFSVIENIIDDSNLNEAVKKQSKRVFLEIAQAEAKVHNQALHSVHFHEVGAIDSIVDIVGTCILLDLLDVDIIYSSPLHDGKGFIECKHGILPVPVPAVMEMLSGTEIPYIIEDVKTELITPTGFALIKTVVREFCDMPVMMVNKVGYGSGKRETGRFNALRAILGTIHEPMENDEVIVLETSIDDMSPEIMGYTFEALMGKGALDVYCSPIIMKKNRPGNLLTVLVNPHDEKNIINIIFKETTTIGLRRSKIQRIKMKIEEAVIKTELGDIRVKIAEFNSIQKISPEYEDCRRLAISTGKPLKKIYDLVCCSIPRK